MKLLTNDQLKVGVPTWYTIPTPLEAGGRTVVCDILAETGLVISDQRAVQPSVVQLYKKDIFKLAAYMRGVVTAMTHYPAREPSPHR